MKKLLILSAALTFGLISCSDDSDDTPPTEMEIYIDQISGNYNGMRIRSDFMVNPPTFDTSYVNMSVSETNMDSVIEIIYNNASQGMLLKYDNEPTQDRFVPMEEFELTPIATFNGDTAVVWSKPSLSALISYTTIAIKIP